MKKLLSLLLAFTMCFTLAGCGGSTESGATSSEASTEDASAEETTEAVEDSSEDTEAASTLIRSTQYGDVQGTDQDGVEVYYGIPYGADPVGELRWADPTAPEAWTDVLDCTEREEIALQMATVYDSDGNASTQLTGTTDCLNLDIYTTSTAEDLPVLVYVHGGNNQTGSSYGEVIGNDLVVNDDCVVVCLNYRTGLLGFNALPALTEEGTSGNYGLLDIAFALQWVRDNIAEFGGDPANVTVSGFSAGGRNVMAMLISPSFEGLFDRAIVFSGGMTICDTDAAAQKDAEIIAVLAVEDGMADTEEEAAQWLMNDTAEVREYLYGIDANRLAEIMSDAGIRMALFPHLFGDDVVLPSEGFDGEYVNDVPVIMLTGTTEFSLFSAFNSYFYTLEDEDTQNAAKTFAISYGSDFYRIFNTQLSAEKMSGSYTSNMYLCQVNYGGSDSATSIPLFGSFHGIFVPMLTTTHNYSSFADFTGAGYTAMAAEFNTYLKNFLYTGNPNSDEETSVEWSAWDADTKQTLVLDASEETGEAFAEMQNVYKTNAEIIAELEADDTIDGEIKDTIITTILNGRWFSDDLDTYFSTPSLW